MKTSPLSFLSYLVALACLLCSSSAQVISFNSVGTLAGGMTPADRAGAPGAEATNWNNMNSNQATPGQPIVGAIPAGGVVDSSGTSLPAVDVTWSGNGVASAGGAGTDDAMMWSSEWDLFGGTPDMSITVSNIPYTVYDVYFYVEDANNAAVRGGDVDANGTVKSITMFNAPAGYVEADSAFTWNAVTTATGSYLRIPDVTGSTLRLQMEAKNVSVPRLRMSGFQIVRANTTLPVVVNRPASDIAIGSATANGELLDNGEGVDPAEVTIFWGPSDGGGDALAWAGSAAAGTFGEPETFSAALSGLVGNTLYYYRAFASNSAGDVWAPSSQTFTTLPEPEFPEVENRPPTMVGLDSATLNGELLNNGLGADTSEVAIHWGEVDGGDDALAWENMAAAGSLSAPGLFSAQISGLSSGTQYYFRTFASNSAGSDWAPASGVFVTQFPPVYAISLNFIRASTGETALDAIDPAGVVPARNWNNSTVANANAATGIALVDDAGDDSGATADWQSGAASWSVGTAGAGGEADKKMMAGYLDQDADGNGQIHTITVTGIPYATYDVYLYHSSNGGPNRGARYGANGTDLFTRNLAPANTFDGFVNDQHASIGDSNSSAGGGNYVLWEGLSGTLNIEAQGIGASDGGFAGSGDTRRAPVQGIQIVRAAPDAGFEITSIVENGDGTITLMWNSEVGADYFIDTADSMKAKDQPGGWFEQDDFRAGDTVSTYTHALPVPAPPRLFYRIRRG